MLTIVLTIVLTHANCYLQVVQCPSNTVVNTKDPHSGLEAGATSGQGGAASLYSGGETVCTLYTRVSYTCLCIHACQLHVSPRSVGRHVR